MPIKVEMPRLSDTMQQGTVVKWSVKEGQSVKSGDVLADIETDKATMELQTFDEGVVAAITTPPGQTVPVGTTIVVLAARGEDPAAVKAALGSGGAMTQAPAKAAGAAPAQASAGSTSPPAVSSGAVAAGSAAGAVAHGNGARVVGHGAGSNGSGTGGRIFASPLAKKIAEEKGVDLAKVTGTGPSGRIVRADVEAAASAAPSRVQAPSIGGGMVSLPAAHAALSSRRVALSTMRRVIAQRLVESKQTIPHYQVTVDVDMEPLEALRKQLNEQLASQGVKLSVNDFLVKACALAMHQHPAVNSRWAGDAVEYVAEVNVGVAIALPTHEDGTGGGLVVATLRQADQLGLRQISSQTRQLSEKARGKGLAPAEMSDSTFTISNLGMYGVAHFTAIINPPNTAILAVGAARDVPVVKNGAVVPGKVMSMTMSSDHRVIDGAMAAQYLATVKGLLEKPATLLV